MERSLLGNFLLLLLLLPLLLPTTATNNVHVHHPGPAYIAHLEQKIEALQDRLRHSSCGSEQSNNDTDETMTTQTSPSLSNPDRLSIGSRERLSTISADSYSSSSSSSFLKHHLTGGSSGSSGGGGSSNSSSGTTKKMASMRRTDTTMASSSSSVDEMMMMPTKYIETITTEPRGKPFGFDILRQLINFINHTGTAPTLPQDSSLKVVQALDSSHSIDNLLAGPMSSNTLLPPAKDEALKLVEIAFGEAFHLWPFVERSQIETTIYRLYDTNTFGRDFGDKEELGLVYSVLALGQRFDHSTTVLAETRRVQGIAYFAAAQELVPLSHCDRNLSAIQTVLCLALFLKAASALGRTHSYLAAAASAALRLGLHEDTPGFPKDESVLRRRVWSALNVFDAYTSIALGVPRTVGFECDEQDFYPSMSSMGSESGLVASNEHMEMMCTLSRGITAVHNTATARRSAGLGAYSISQQAIQEAGAELEEWARNCPLPLQAADHMTRLVPIFLIHDSGNVSTLTLHLTRSQLYLAYAYDYAQLLLYSPFAHYLTMPTVEINSPPYTLGLKAVNAALHAIQVAELLHKQLRLDEAYFLTVDVLVIAATTLLVFELGSGRESPWVHEALHASGIAKGLLLEMSLHSQTAAHCWEALAVRSTQGSPTAIQTRVKKTKAPGTIQMPPRFDHRPATLHQIDSAVDVGFNSLQFSQTESVAFGGPHMMPIEGGVL